MADKLVKNKVLAALESVSGPTATMWDGETEYFKSLQFGVGDVLYPLPFLGGNGKTMGSIPDGSILQVVNGKWQAVSLAEAESLSFGNETF